MVGVVEEEQSTKGSKDRRRLDDATTARPGHMVSSSLLYVRTGTRSLVSDREGSCWTCRTGKNGTDGWRKGDLAREPRDSSVVGHPPNLFSFFYGKAPAWSIYCLSQLQVRVLC